MCSFYIELHSIKSVLQDLASQLSRSGSHPWTSPFRPSATSPTQLSIPCMPSISISVKSISVKTDIKCHLWHLLFQVFAHGAVHHYSSSDTFLVQLPASSSSDSAHASEGAVHGKRREYFIYWLQLFSVWCNSLRHPFQIMSLSDGDTLFSTNSTVSLLLQPIRSHHAYSTKSTPQNVFVPQRIKIRRS